MKDKEYFDDKMFVFTNKKLKVLAMKYSDKVNLPLYFIVDEAIRLYLEKNNVKIDNTPKKPQLV